MPGDFDVERLAAASAGYVGAEIEQAIVDAMYVYAVSDLEQHPNSELDAFVPCDVEIVWSAAQDRAALLLNGRPHAVFDFAGKRGFCRSNFPPGSGWSASGHAWDDHAADFIADGLTDH